MQTSRMRRSLGWVEVLFYLAGVALLAVFFQIRADNEAQRAAGVRAFEQAADRQVELADPRNGGTVSATVAVPDQELWADKRIAEYEESLKVPTAPPLAVLTIDKLGIQVPVYDGADDLNLNRGVGRIRGTARIDAVGNLGVAGHRDGFFRGLKDIAPGDRIELQTPRGETTYTVSAIDIVEPEDVSVLAPTTDKSITLVTCYPFYFVGHAPKRFIVKARAGQILAEN